MRIPSKVSITGTPPKCIVKVNGEPIAVTSVDLHLDCESLPQAVISLPVLEDVDVETEADIAVDERTRLALLRLGWTPPGEQPDDKAIELWISVNPQKFEAWFLRRQRIHGQRIGHG